MSGKVGYIARTDRGSRIDSVRIVGPRRDEAWKPHSGAPGASAAAGDALWQPDAMLAGAHWIKERLTSTDAGATGVLDLLVLDIEGSVCSWVTSPSTEPAVVAMSTRPLASGGPGGESLASEETLPITPLSFYGGEMGEATIQPLASGAVEAGPMDAGSANPARSALLGRWRKGAVEETPAASLRLAALAVTDAPAKLLLDALDAAGVSVAAVISMWHALAQAWDPASPAATPQASDARGAGVAADVAPCAAIVMLDPVGRLVWCWSRAGTLLAAGAMRLAPARTEDDATALTMPTGVSAPGPVWTVGPAEAARLVNEWIAWATQLGVVPGRVALVLTDAIAPEAAAAFGRTLAGAWAGTPLDVGRYPDPVGATLGRLALHHADAGPPITDEDTLVPLTNRPGQTQRRLYTWTAAAIAAAAGLCFVSAWRLWAAAAEIRAGSTTATQRTDALIQANVPGALAAREGPVAVLESRLKKRREEIERSREDEAMPILPELATLSLVLADPEIQLNRADFSATGVFLDTSVTDIAAAEELQRSLAAVSDSAVENWEPRFTNAGPRVNANFTGRWRPPAKIGPRPAPNPAAGAATNAPATPPPSPAASVKAAPATPAGTPNTSGAATPKPAADSTAAPHSGPASGGASSTGDPTPAENAPAEGAPGHSATPAPAIRPMSPPVPPAVSPPATSPQTESASPLAPGPGTPASPDLKPGPATPAPAGTGGGA